MRLDEKLDIIQENISKVYQAGFDVGALSASGKKFTTGTVTFSTTKTQQEVTHNLGVIPSSITLYPKDLSVIPPTETEEAKGKVYKFVHFYNLSGAINNGYDYQGNTNTGRFTWGSTNNSGNINVDSRVDETTFTTGATGAAYKYPANVEFEWVAIE